MNTVTSADGTTIAYDRTGGGPPVILVDGAFCGQAFGPMPGLAPLLAKHFTVYGYDRRGRGDSGNTQPYAVEREIEDIEALIDAAGGEASRYGGKSPAWMRNGVQALADAVAQSQRRTLPGQTGEAA
jgi:pimeloyl-ACP methyl ester carboxylesterase